MSDSICKCGHSEFDHIPEPMMALRGFGRFCGKCSCLNYGENMKTTEVQKAIRETAEECAGIVKKMIPWEPSVTQAIRERFLKP